MYHLLRLVLSSAAHSVASCALYDLSYTHL
jgi:hypothetical protein